MIRALSILALAAAAPAADIMHVPLLVKYHQESHAVAGALVALGLDSGLAEVTPLRPIDRAVIAVGVALALGAAKEYLVDLHPRRKEIAPWGVGATAALAIRWEFQW